MKRLIRKAEHDIDNRDFAILYIDGEVLQANTHKDAVNDFLISKQKSDTLDGTASDYIWDDFGQYGEKVAFLHYASDYRLDGDGNITNEPTIYFGDSIGVSMEEVVSAVAIKYPGIPIYDDIDYDIVPVPKNNLGLVGEIHQYITRLANIKMIKNLINEAYHDFNSRDEAITLINDTIYTGSTHGKSINKWLSENNQPKMPMDSFYRPSEDEYDVIGLDTAKVAFAHVVNGEKAIYIDSTSLQNYMLDEVAQLLKNQYPDYSIYDDEYVMNEDENGELQEEFPLLIATRLIKK